MHKTVKNVEKNDNVIIINNISVMCLYVLRLFRVCIKHISDINFPYHANHIRNISLFLILCQKCNNHLKLMYYFVCIYVFL